MFYVLCMYLPGSSVKIIYLNNPEERRWKRARECIPRTYKGSRSVLSSTATVAAAACSGRSITDGAAVVRSGRCFILHGEGVYHLPSTTGRVRVRVAPSPALVLLWLMWLQLQQRTNKQQTMNTTSIIPACLVNLHIPKVGGQVGAFTWMTNIYDAYTYLEVRIQSLSQWTKRYLWPGGNKTAGQCREHNSGSLHTLTYLDLAGLLGTRVHIVNFHSTGICSHTS